MTTSEHESTESDALSMFFNDDFVPHEYLDALFDFTLKSSSTSSATLLGRYQARAKLDSINTLQQLQSKCSGLLAHLDYYTKELTGDLEDRIKKLQATSTVLSYEDSTEEMNTSTTRLEYYVDNLNNFINSLHEDVSKYQKDIKSLESSPEDKEVLDSLTKLRNAKTKILQVLKVFETAKLVVTTADLEEDEDNIDSVARTNNQQLRKINIDLDIFTKSIDLLEDAIDEELKQKSIEMGEIMKKIDSLIALLPLFKGLPQFYSAYSLFVERISEKRLNDK